MKKNKKLYFFSYISDKKNILTRLSLKFLFRGIKLDEEQLEEVDETENPIIVYATSDKNNLAFLHSQIKNGDKLPAPAFYFNSSFLFSQPVSTLVKIIYSKIRHVLTKFSIPDPYAGFYQHCLTEKNKAGFLSLSETKGFYKYFASKKQDPLLMLLELQKTTERPILIVPMLLLFSQRPPKTNPGLVDIIFGTEAKPGLSRKIYQLLIGSKKTFISFSSPINLKTFQSGTGAEKKDIAGQAILLRRNLQTKFEKHKKSILGPTLKSRKEIIDNILSSSKVQDFLFKYSSETDGDMTKIQKEAESILQEVAANYSMNWIKAYDVVLTWILKNIFEGMNIDQKGLAKVKEYANKGPLILVPCHKSHLDYLILSYVFHHNQMPCPHIAAGKNLSFWPLGTIFRGGGAFFIRRTFKGAKLYSEIFSAYMQELIKEGFNIEFFIEGGRSRTGKLLSPKFGILAQIVQAFKQSSQEDLIIVPIFIGYDRVLEEKSYLKELSGGEKDPENMSGLIKARRFLNKKYGKVYVNFNDPISLKEYSKDSLSSGITEKEMIEKLGLNIVDQIAKVSIITPYSIVSSALLNSRKNALSLEKLKDIIDTYINYLKLSNAPFSDTLVTNPDASVEIVLETFESRGFITKDQTANLYLIHENKRAVLDYYKNNSISFFIPAAYTALSIMEMEAFQFSASDLHISFDKYQQLFSRDFIPDQINPPDFIVRKTLKAFIEEAIIIPHETLPDTYKMTGSGYKKLKGFASFLLPYLEAYWVASSFFMKYPSEDIEPKDAPKKALSLGTRMYKRGEIHFNESLSKINLKNGIDYIKSKNIKGNEDKDEINKIINIIERAITSILD